MFGLNSVRLMLLFASTVDTDCFRSWFQIPPISEKVSIFAFIELVENILNCIFIFQNVVAQIFGGPIRGPCGAPCQHITRYITRSLPVMNQPALPNMFPNLNLAFSTNVPIEVAQLANTGIPLNYGYGQNLHINKLPYNSLPVNQLIKTRSPKTVLVKFNIPIVKRVPKSTFPLYNNLQYTLGNNFKITNFPLNNQIINNLPLNILPRETIHPSYNYVQQRLPLSVNNRVVTNVPVVPLNRLSNLPKFNGMPVIKVKQTLYKML